MDIYTSGEVIKLWIDAPGYQIVTDASCVIYGHNGEVLASDLAVATVEGLGNNLAFAISVPAEINIMADENIREMRLARVQITSDDIESTLDHQYIIELEDVLIEGVNSFQTYKDAILTALDVASIPAWADAEKRDRTGALLSAAINIGSMRFKVAHCSDNKCINTQTLPDITSLSKEELLQLPRAFVNALKRAQVIEANHLLLDGNSSIEHMVNAGLQSNTVSESKQFFRSRRGIVRKVCNRAFGEISRWVDSEIRIARC